MPSIATDALFVNNPAPTVPFKILPSDALYRLGCLSRCHAQEFTVSCSGQVMSIRSDTTYGPRLLNSWLPAETWVEALRKIGLIDEEITFSVRQFNAAFAKSASYGSVMSRFDGSNQTGMFRLTFQHQHYYYLTQEMKQAMYPSPPNRAWKERVLEIAANVLVIPSTRARPSTVDSTTVVLATSVGADVVANPDVQESPNKRQRVENVTATCSYYWPESPEAYQLFRPRQSSGDGGRRASDSTDTTTIQSPQEAVECRIIQLQAVHESTEGWRGVVKGGDADNYCTKTEIFEIRQRATILCLAYQLALANMNQWTWHECCKEACKTLNSLGMYQATFYKTVAQWNMVFRKFECFQHPNPYVQCGKRPLPRLLEIYPDAKDQIVAFGVKNLATLTIEGLHDFIVSIVIPRLALLWQKDEEEAVMATAHATTNRSTHATTNRSSVPSCGSNMAPPGTSTANNNQEVVNELFLRSYGLESMSFTTAWCWMRLLGFQYDARKKSFYVDGHEREDVVANRTTFCTSYLTELEPYCNRWVQLSMRTAMTMKDVDVELGHIYFDVISNEQRIEFHIDYWNRIGPERIEATTSIQVLSMARPIMIVGQDESVFAQYLLGAKTWLDWTKRTATATPKVGRGWVYAVSVCFARVWVRETVDK